MVKTIHNVDRRKKFRVASENPAKLDVARQILIQHRGEPTLIIGMYVEQIKEIEGVAGVHIMAIEWEEAVQPIVEGAGLFPRPTFNGK